MPLSALNKIFNVRSEEWSRIFVAYFVRFFYRVSFVLGWTLLVAMFLNKYGIAQLPYLLILNAFFTVIGSLFYATLLERFQRGSLIVFTILAMVALLAVDVFFTQPEDVLFFGLLIVGISVFMMQLRILLIAHVEHMFTPLESERAFPLVEASETLGGIVAGLLLASLSASFEPITFLYFWLGLILMILPLLVLDKKLHHRIRLVADGAKAKSRLGVLDRIKSEFVNSKQAKFFVGLIAIVFLQWFIFNLLEYQYTVAVFQNVDSVVFEAGSGFEHAFIHDLGTLFALFSVSALVVQLLIGSRILNALGVIGTMLMHVLVTFMSILSLIFSFGFGTAVFAKNNFTMTTVLHTTAYHSSYYAISGKFRGQVREFLEGVVRPFGALLGTSCLLVLKSFLDVEFLVSYTNALTMSAVIALGYITYRQQAKYTAVALDDLKNSKDKKARMNAVDILGQRGHKNSLSVLRRLLHKKSESVTLRVRILHALAELKDFGALPDIVKCLKSDNATIREEALDALLKFDSLLGDSNKHLVAKHDLIEDLKALYKTEVNDLILMKIMHLMSRISVVAAAEFLFSVLEDAKPANRAEAIYALGSYDDKGVINLVKPFLSSRHLKEKINAAIVLIKFPTMYDQCLDIVRSFVEGSGAKRKAYGLYAVGELKLKKYVKLCKKELKARDKFVRMHAALALLKLGDGKVMADIVELLFDENHKIAGRLRVLLQDVDLNLSREINRLVMTKVSGKIDEILKESEADSLADLNQSELVRFKWFYTLVGEYEEVEIIDGIMKKIYA